jgi:hypothetical protein
MALTLFYPRMNAGGIILCDDYGFTNKPGQKRALDNCLVDTAESAIHVITGRERFVKQ